MKKLVKSNLILFKGVIYVWIFWKYNVYNNTLSQFPSYQHIVVQEWSSGLTKFKHHHGDEKHPLKSGPNPPQLHAAAPLPVDSVTEQSVKSPGSPWKRRAAPQPPRFNLTEKKPSEASSCSTTWVRVRGVCECSAGVG